MTKADIETEWVPEEELASSARVRPLRRKWELSPQEREELHEAWLMMQAQELHPFLDIAEVRQGYNAFLKYGNWISRGARHGEAAGSCAFDTHDYDRWLREQRGVRAEPVEE